MRLLTTCGSTFYFAAGTTVASSLQPGDVIVGHGTAGSGATIGILARVVSVTISADGTIVVTTSPARLTDVISSGTVWYSKPLTQSQLKTATPLVAGVVVKDLSGSCSSRSPTGFGVSLNHVLVGSSGKQVALNGCLKLSFRTDFALHIGLFSGVKEFRTVLVTTSSQLLSLDTTAAINLTKETPIASYTFTPLPVSPPFVWITPNITVYLGTEVQADGSVQLAVTLQENATGGVEYQQGRGWSSIHSFTPSFTAPSSQFKAHANVTGYVEPNFSLQVDDLAGPFVALKGYVQGDAWAATGGGATLGWDLYGGVAGYAGMMADPLGWNLGQIQLQLFDKRILLASSAAGVLADTAPPSVPQHLAAKAVSSSEIDLTWGLSTDDSAVKDYRIYKDGRDWKTVASRFAADTGLGAQTRACYSVEAVDVAGNVSGPTATVCATTPPAVDKTPPTMPTGLKVSTVAGDFITLSWNPSTDNVGVQGYKVSRNGAPIAAITQTPYTQYTDTPLAAGTKYCYTVEAFDASGNLSTQSANVCVTTTPSSSSTSGSNPTPTVVGKPIPVGADPRALAISPNGEYVYVANTYDDTVSVIDTATHAVVGEPIPVGGGPIALAISPNGEDVYVANNGNSTVSVIDAATHTVVGQTIPVGGYPAALAIGPNGQYVYVANRPGGAGSVSVIDTTTHTVVGKPIPISPGALAINPNGKEVYVAHEYGDAVSVISTTTNTVVGKPIPMGNYLTALAISPNGQYVYVENLDYSISVISTVTRTVVGNIPVSYGSGALAISPNGKELYVANSYDDTVSVIDTATDAVVGEPIPVGADPSALAITPNGKEVYVVNNYDDTVSVIATPQVAAEQRQVQAIVDRYVQAIKSQVERIWLRPSGSAAGLSCTVEVKLFPGGEVTGVKIAKGSGDPVFDRSVETAVRKASPLPMPSDPSLFNQFRDLTFVFKPMQ